MRPIVLSGLAVVIITLMFCTAPTQAQTPTPFPTPTIAPYPGSSSSQIPVNLSGISTTFTLISDVLGYSNEISSSVLISMTLPTTLTISASNPFSIARGFVVVLGDVAWLQILTVFFTAAILIITLIMMIRLVVSLWGIIERIISLIKLIPGL